MRFLVFGDPEGKVRYGEVARLANKFLGKGDWIIFMGDYFSNQLTAYKYFRQGRLFPESSVFRDLYKRFKVVLVFGNKDLQSRFFDLHERRERFHENLILVEDFHGKVPGEINLFFLNGSNLTNVDISRRAKRLVRRIGTSIEKYRKKRGVQSLRLVDLPKEEVNRIRRGYAFEFKLIYDYPYLTNFDFLKDLRERDFDILLTHTPPLMKGSELVMGNYPDLALYKEVRGGVCPARREGKKVKKGNVGDERVLKFVKRTRCKLVICGHIHEASGVAYLKDKLIINPGSKIAFSNRKKILPFTLIETDQDLTRFRILLRNWSGTYEKEV